MRRMCRTTLPPLIAGLLAGLLYAIVTVPLSAATSATHSKPAAGFHPDYNAAREMTLTGTIQEVVSKHVLGSPVGLHLLVASEKGTVDVHVGSYITKDTRAALHAGLPIQVVGATETLRGQQYLLARQITFGGRTVTLRSATGYMVLPHSTRKAVRRPATAKPSANGGAR